MLHLKFITGKRMIKIIFLHFAVVVGTIFPIPFGGFFLPLVYWQINRKEDAIFQIQAKSILNFQLLFNILGFVFMILFWYYFIKNQSHDLYVSYVSLWIFLVLCVLVNIIYPLFVVAKMSVEHKVRNYYPVNLRLLK